MQAAVPLNRLLLLLSSRQLGTSPIPSPASPTPVCLGLGHRPGAASPPHLPRALRELCNRRRWQSPGGFYANTAGWQRCQGGGLPAHPKTAAHPPNSCTPHKQLHTPKTAAQPQRAAPQKAAPLTRCHAPLPLCFLEHPRKTKQSWEPRRCQVPGPLTWALLLFGTRGSEALGALPVPPQLPPQGNELSVPCPPPSLANPHSGPGTVW